MLNKELLTCFILLKMNKRKDSVDDYTLSVWRWKSKEWMSCKILSITIICLHFYLKLKENKTIDLEDCNYLFLLSSGTSQILIQSNDLITKICLSFHGHGLNDLEFLKMIIYKRK